MIRRLLALALSSTLLVTLAATLGTSPAHADWTPPSPTVANFDGVTLVDSRLTSHLVWPTTTSTGNQSLSVAHRLPGAEWSTPSVFNSGPGTIHSVQLAEATAGMVVAVWALRQADGTEHVFTARRLSDGAWFGPSRLSATATASAAPVLTSNRRGDLAVVWLNGDHITARLAPAGGAWGAPLSLFQSSLATPNIKAGMDDNGLITVGWRNKIYATSDAAAIVTRDLPVTATSAAQAGDIQIVGSVTNAATFQLAVGASGHRAVAMATTSESQTIHRRSPGEAQWPTAEVLGTVSDFRMVVLPTGTTVLAFTRSGSGLIGRSAAPGAPWSEKTLATGTYLFDGLSLDAADGSARVAYSPGTSTSGVLQLTAQVQRFSGGTWQPPLTLPRTVASQWSRSNLSAYDGYLAGLLVVHDLTTTKATIHTIEWDPKAPQIPVTTIPHTFIDQPGTFSVEVTDFTPVRVTWDFGDGTTATGHRVTHTYSTGGVYPVTVTATDAAGNTTIRTGTSHVTREGVVPPPDDTPPPPGGTPPPGSTPPPSVPPPGETPPTGVAPQVTSFTLSRARISASGTPRATVARIRLTAAAKVTLVFKKVGSQRTLRRQVTLDAGASRVKITARLTRKLRLKPGRYTVTARPANAYGTGTPRTVRLRVTR